MRFIAIYLVGFFFAGCSTLGPTSHKSDLRFGERKVKEAVFSVYVEAPQNTADEVLKGALDRKCAEVTLAQGYRYYAPYNLGVMGIGTFKNPESRKNVWLRRGTTIKMYNKESAPKDAIDASEVLKK